MPRLNGQSALERSFFDAIERYQEERYDAGQDHAEAIEARVEQFNADGYMVKADGSVVSWIDIDERLYDYPEMYLTTHDNQTTEQNIEYAKKVSIDRVRLIAETIRQFAEEEA